jgi:DNA-binding transcriptional LysR family regulator
MRRVTLSQIEAFCCIMRYGSFRAAASHLNLTQPTLSIRIRTMEEVLGFPLFKKVGRGTQPTRDAEAILPHAERLLVMADDFPARPKSTDALRGSLRLGAPDCFGTICLPDLLGELRKRFPDLRPAITIDRAPALCKALNARELDIAFITEPKTGAHIRLEPLGGSHHSWVSGPGLQLPNRVLTPRDLADTEIFVYPAPSNQMRMVLDWFAAGSIHASAIRTCNSLSVILPLVLAGAGVSLLPSGFLRNDRRSRSLRYLETKPAIPYSQYVAAYQSDKAGPTMHAVIEMAWAIMCNRRFVERAPGKPLAQPGKRLMGRPSSKPGIPRYVGTAFDVNLLGERAES